MTAKFRHIIEQLTGLVTFRNVRTMTDDDFIADIEAANVLCSLYDDLGIDRNGIRRGMSGLHAELMRRIASKEEIQHAIPLIKALYRLVYDKGEDFGPAKWRAALNEMCCKVVDSYRKNPIIDSTEYLFALDIACRLEDASFNPYHNGAERFSAKASPLLQEHKEAIAALLEDFDNLPLAERIRRVRAYERASLSFTPDNREEWIIAREKLENTDLTELDDDTLIIWWEITDEPPVKELKKRAGNSRLMAVEYLQAQIFTEFARESRLKAKRKLERELKTLNDDIIGDIIPIKITAHMSVATLYALETIFYLRLQLAQVGWEDNEPVYEALCQDRFGQIAKALRRKYKKAESLNEKIEILERLSTIGQFIHSNDLQFALEEADKLLRHLSSSSASQSSQICCSVFRPGVGSLECYQTQRLRLSWIPNINSENESQIVADLLNSIPNSSFLIPNLEDHVFYMATLALIIDYVTPSEREAIFNRFTEIFETTLNPQLSTINHQLPAIESLLTLAAYWNSDPRLREKLRDLTAPLARGSEFSELKIDEYQSNQFPMSKLATEAQQPTRSGSVQGEIPCADLSLPVLRVNPIAAEIYSRIDALTGKYVPHPIPA